MSKPKPRQTCAPFLLDEAGTQHIFAPFFHSDSKVSGNLPTRIETVSGGGCRAEVFWDGIHLKWDRCPVGSVACRYIWDEVIEVVDYDQLILCLSTGYGTVRVLIKAEGQSEQRFEMKTNGKRGELIVPLGSDRIESIVLECIPVESGLGLVVLNWFGLGNREATRAHEKSTYQFDAAWPGLLLPEIDWRRPVFARGLLFGEDKLEILRERRQAPGWDKVFATMEKQAEAWLDRCPEEQIGRFIPWPDARYMRGHQLREDTFFYGPLTLAMVGLVNQDERMIGLALRYLMSMLHTQHWCPPENRVIGATWDSKCFQEENMVIHVALLADWLDAGLTRHAKELARKCIWDKGLSVIERDLMKYEYMWGMNQGAWFCRARILGGLMLENKWPRMGEYVDRGYQDMMEIMNRYILPDGGTDEGVSYFGVTMHAVLHGILAYGKARQQEPLALMPQHFEKVASYVATLSSTTPGKILVEGDASTSCIPGDAMPILAGLLPGSVYHSLFASALREEAVGNYMKMYLPSFELGFALGPDEFKSPSNIVPIFSLLPHTGHLTSCRESEGHNARWHLIGAKAHASHTHADKGGLLLEVDGKPVLIDRGVVRYDDIRSLTMRRTCYHNAITPVREDGTFPDQAPLSEAQIPEGEGDESRLRASINISHVWRKEMKRCSRNVTSESPFEMEVLDEGELSKPGAVAFHLQSLRPFIIEDSLVRLPFEGGELLIDAPWAERVEQGVDSIDLDQQDVHHAIWYSESLTGFELNTRIGIQFIDT